MLYISFCLRFSICLLYVYSDFSSIPCTLNSAYLFPLVCISIIYTFVTLFLIYEHLVRIMES